MTHVCLFALLLLALTSRAQDDAGYITPPKDIQDMLLAKPTPGISISDNGQWILFSEQNSYSSVEELARPELRIAGLRIDPANYTRSRQRYINNIYLKKTGEPKEYKIAGLPADLAASSISWSPDDKKIAFIHTTATKADLY